MFSWTSFNFTCIYNWTKIGKIVENFKTKFKLNEKCFTSRKLNSGPHICFDTEMLQSSLQLIVQEPGSCRESRVKNSTLKKQNKQIFPFPKRHQQINKWTFLKLFSNCSRMSQVFNLSSFFWTKCDKIEIN